MKRHYSHIVVGAGALGSAAAYWLTRSGATDVLVLEQYGLGHRRRRLRGPLPDHPARLSLAGVHRADAGRL